MQPVHVQIALDVFLFFVIIRIVWNRFILPAYRSVSNSYAIGFRALSLQKDSLRPQLAMFYEIKMWSFQLTGEVTYAELCLARPTTLTTSADTKLTCLNSVGGLGSLGGFGSGLGVLVGGKPYAKEATVYACIDHTARPPKIDQVCQPANGGANLGTALLQDPIGLSAKQQQQHHPREVVTVRTPLISTQESCV